MSGILWPAVRSEWTKLRTQPGTTLARDPVRLSLGGLGLGRALVVLLAVRPAAGEWETGIALATYLPIAPWAGLAVLGARAVVALTAGWLVAAYRDV